MAIASAILAITSAILNIPTHVAIPSATAATTSATTLSGYSSSHNWQSTSSAINHSGFSICHIGNNICQTVRVLKPLSGFPSTTHYKSSDTISVTSKKWVITSVQNNGNNISHNQNKNKTIKENILDTNISGCSCKYNIFSYM